MAYHTKIKAFWGIQVNFEDLPLIDVVKKYHQENKDHKKDIDLSKYDEIYQYAFKVIGPEKSIAMILSIDKSLVVTSWIESECEMKFYIAFTEPIVVYDNFKDKHIINELISLQHTAPKIEANLALKLKKYGVDMIPTPKIVTYYDRT